MKHIYLPFILIIIAIFESCQTSRPIVEDYRTETYIQRMKLFEENPINHKQTVFFGNSITQAGRWSSYFDADVVNRGISGDNTQGMLARIDEVAKKHPAKIFILAGINDISLGRSNAEIIYNYEVLVEKITNTSPVTKIYIQSVLPINNAFGVYSRLKGKEKQIIELNFLLKQLSNKLGVQFINLYPYFIGENGHLKEDFTGDGLHLNEEAYLLWSNIIRRYVE